MAEERRAMELELSKLTFQRELQIIQADVRLRVNGEVLVDEPLCIDVGMPALVNSCFENVTPSRSATGPGSWKRVPFFVCGCGDPECRVYAFRVARPSPGVVRLTEVEEKPDGSFREYGDYLLPEAEYSREIDRVARQFLAFVEGIDYRPLQVDTVPIIEELLGIRKRRSD